MHLLIFLLFDFPKLNLREGFRHFGCNIFEICFCRLKPSFFMFSALVCLHEQQYFICQTFIASHQTSHHKCHNTERIEVSSSVG